MKQLLNISWLLALVACGSVSDRANSMEEPNSDPFRPQFHYTPQKGWMNDPNGMVYYEGEYHLFYQYYPYGTIWGPMHWGHAVSNDLVKWEELPIGLYPDDVGLIYSGSAVMDWNNTTGFGADGVPPMVAIYTTHEMYGEKIGRKDFQTQSVAYSLDRGRTWSKYDNNPVLPNSGKKDFRDPKVFWHEESRKWVMSLAVANTIEFYGSADLKEWNFLSAFGTEGQKGGVWECPDLFKLKVGETGEERWVLLVSLNPGGPNGGSGTQYFVGDFDGTAFINENESERILWLDFGADNYAGVSWSDIPSEDGRRIYIGWMSNWNYARLAPTHPWRSAMTMPRELSLKQTEKGIRIVGQPVVELEDLRKEPLILSNHELSETMGVANSINPQQFEAELKFSWDEDLPFMGLRLSNDLGNELLFGYDARSKQYTFDRTKSRKENLGSNFNTEIHNIPIAPDTDRKEVTMRIFVDACSIEAFVEDGEFQITELFYPDQSLKRVELFSFGGNSFVNEAKFYNLESIR